MESKLQPKEESQSVKTVSAVPLISLFAFMNKREIDHVQAIQGLRALHPGNQFIDVAFLEDPRSRIPWDVFSIVLDRCDELLGDAGWENEFVIESFSSMKTWVPYINAISRLVTSPKQLYTIAFHLVGSGQFGEALTDRSEVLPNGEILTELKLHEGLRGCSAYFRISHASHVWIPMVIGLPASRVRSEISPFHARYFVTPPPSATIFSRIKRAAQTLFSDEAALRELFTKESELRKSYDALLVSEKHLMEARTALENRVAERTEKLEAIRTLVNGISHEINNVLHGIGLSVESARNMLGQDDPASTRLAVAQSFTDRGRDLMLQVHAFGKNTRSNRKPVDLIKLLKEMTPLIQTMLPADIELVVATEPATPLMIDADAVQIRQLVTNLALNGMHAMIKSGGQLTLSAKEHSPKQISLIVEDQGEGIPVSIRNRIFEPFFTTRPVGKGTGMGLAVVHGIVETHSGRIELESAQGVGTQFKIIFDRSKIDVEESPIPDIKTVSQKENHRILLVDDESGLLEVLEELLVLEGFEVQATSNPENAAAHLRKSPDSIDVLLTDFVMPQMSGLELARIARNLRPDIPIIICTGYDQSTELRTPDSRRLYDICLSKPIEAKALTRVISEVMQSRFTQANG